MRKPALTHEELQLLMRFADGEASTDDEARAVRMLAQHPDAHDVVLETMTLGDWVRETAEAPALGFDISGAVMARLDVGEQPKLVADRPTLPSQATAEARKVIAFPKPAPLRWGAAVVAALAVAAGIAFVIERPSAPTGPVAHLEPVAAPADTVGVAVDHVESPNGVSVFYLPAALNANASSVVVWIDDDSTPAPPGTAAVPSAGASQVPQHAPGEKK